MEIKKEIPKGALCAFDLNHECTESCTAFAIMAISRSQLHWDSTAKQYLAMPTREPYVGPFCRRGPFPIGLDADEQTIVPKPKERDSPDIA